MTEEELHTTIEELVPGLSEAAKVVMLRSVEKKEVAQCIEVIKDLMPGISGFEMTEIINEAVLTIVDNPSLVLMGLVRTICGMKTLETVLDTSRISPHQRTVIFG